MNIAYCMKLKQYAIIDVTIIAIGFVGESSIVNRISQNQEISRLKSEIDEYNRRFEQDKKTLEAFLERGAISKAQFDKRLGDSLSRWECQVLLINHAIMSPSKAGSWIR